MTLPLSSKSAAPKSADDANCFALDVSRDMEGAETFEVICEITNWQPSDPAVGIFGPTFDIDAYTMDGQSFQLTELEHDRAFEQACDNLERWAEEAENDARD